jgi:hypothetical protein
MRADATGFADTGQLVLVAQGATAYGERSTREKEPAVKSPTVVALLLVALAIGCSAEETAPTEYSIFAADDESLSIERIPGSDQIIVSHERDGQTSTIQTSAASLTADRAELDALIDGVDQALISEARAEVLTRQTYGTESTELKACELAVLGAGAEDKSDTGRPRNAKEPLDQDPCATCCWTSYSICYWGNVEHMGFHGAGVYCGSIYGCCC